MTKREKIVEMMAKGLQDYYNADYICVDVWEDGRMDDKIYTRQQNSRLNYGDDAPVMTIEVRAPKSGEDEADCEYSDAVSVVEDALDNAIRDAQETLDQRAMKPIYREGVPTDQYEQGDTIDINDLLDEEAE